MGLTLATDFDETLTVLDTIAYLPRLAAEQLPPCEAERLLSRWTEGSASYYAEWHEVVRDGLAEATAIGEPREALETFVRRFDRLERSSLDKVEAMGFLRGIPRRALHRVGRRVEIRDGALEVLAHAQRRGVSLHVISVNWAADIIRSALNGLSASIHSNDLCFDRHDVSTGHLCRRIVSALDKRTRLRDLRAEGGPCVYVGDSITDLPALLDADVGILVGDKPLPTRVCERLDVPLLPLEHRAEWPKAECIYRANSWKEIGAALVELL